MNDSTSYRHNNISLSLKSSMGFYKLFEEELKGFYWTKKELIFILPEIIDLCTSFDLKLSLRCYLMVAKKQVKRLDRIFELLHEPADAKKCDTMELLIRDAVENIKKVKDAMERESKIIDSSQKIVQYEIASYNALYNFAGILQLTSITPLLQETLNEERAIDEILTRLFEGESDIGEVA